jgi:hypothetical protein
VYKYKTSLSCHVARNESTFKVPQNFTNNSQDEDKTRRNYEVSFKIVTFPYFSSCGLESLIRCVSEFRKPTVNFVMAVPLSVCPHGIIHSHWTDFHKIWYLRIFRKVPRKNLSRLTDTLHEDPCTFMVIARWILLKMRKFSDKSCKENENTFYVQQLFFWKSCRLWDNVEKYSRDRQTTDENITQCMYFSCWINKATDTHSELVILIAFARQKLLRERTWILRYRYVPCLVCFRHCISIGPNLLQILTRHGARFDIVLKVNTMCISYWMDYTCHRTVIHPSTEIFRNSMHWRSFWEASNSSANEELSRILWKFKVC